MLEEGRLADLPLSLDGQHVRLLLPTADDRPNRRFDRPLDGSHTAIPHSLSVRLALKSD